MYSLFGVLFHMIGGVAAGSFYMPYKKVKGWHWESYWIVGGLFSWIIAPFLALWITFPEFGAVLFSNTTVLSYTVVFGTLWGIGGLTYGLGIRYLGMSLGNSIILGFSSVLGSLLPAIYYDLSPQAGKISFSQMLQNTGGRIILLGILFCLTGIVILGRAGYMKERDNVSPTESPKAQGDFNLKKGLLVAVFSGILSSCFNYGIEAGKPLADAAIALGVNPLFQNNISFVLILWGGFTINIVWCIYLNIKNRSFTDYFDTSKPLQRNYLFCAIAGITWFLQFFFYGMGESRLGNGASSWILHMSSIILVANIWGVVLKEWNGVTKMTKITMFIGVVVLLLSVALVGYGSTLQ